jgi:hypothetical protein
MKKLIQKHISRPYVMIVFVALLFGFVMTGLIPVGNGYVINPDCTENGKFIESASTECGGFSLLGMDHFLWHPRVTIPVGIMLLVIESLAWAALFFSVLLVIRLFRVLDFNTNPFKGKSSLFAWLSVLFGILATLHFAASPVLSKVLPAEVGCDSTVAYCEPCPGVVPEVHDYTVKKDYGWPFHMVQKVYVKDECGGQPMLQASRFDPVAVVFNVLTWSIIGFAVLHWLQSRPIWSAGSKK